MNSFPTPAEVIRIEVFTHWCGFADPPFHAAKLTITHDGQRLIRQQALVEGSDETPVDAVARFLQALNRPPVPELDPSLFDLPEPVIRSHYGSMWTDDHPAHLVRTIFASGRVITVRTICQHAFMLPLKITDSAAGIDSETYDPRISAAVAALMPAGYMERERLAGILGMLQMDFEEFRRQAKEGKPSTTPAIETVDEPVPSASDPDSIEEQLFRLFSRDESPEERAEAEREGRISERLLKRISVEDLHDVLARGGNPDIADDHGQTALMHAAFPPFNEESFRTLAAAGANVDARRYDGCTGLHLACAGGESHAAREWVRAGADIHARIPEGATPLMLAASWSEIVKLLLSAGADPNAVDQDGHSALVYAILKQSWLDSERQLDSIRELIAAGTDLDQRDRQGITPSGHARAVLARAQLENDVSQAFHPDGKSLRAISDEMRLAKKVIDLITSARGVE
jgi:Ankyrin repeats (3 copies)